MTALVVLRSLIAGTAKAATIRRLAAPDAQHGSAFQAAGAQPRHSAHHKIVQTLRSADRSPLPRVRGIRAGTTWQVFRNWSGTGRNHLAGKRANRGLCVGRNRDQPWTTTPSPHSEQMNSAASRVAMKWKTP